MYQYRFSLVRVIDGDTLVVDIDLGFYVTVRQTVRLVGINTPELHATDPMVRCEAQKAKEFVELWFQQQNESKMDLTLRSEKPISTDKYGRWLARVTASPKGSPLIEAAVLNNDLLHAELAVEYNPR